jgi:hypothetical protein
MSSLRIRLTEYLAEFERLKNKITELETRIRWLESRPANTEVQVQERIVEKIVEKIVYRDRPEPDSDIDREFSEREDIEDTYTVVGRVKVGEAEVVLPKDA